MWVWVNSGSWWWTGRPGVLRFMGSRRVGHNWATELTECGLINDTLDIMLDPQTLLSYNWKFVLFYQLFLICPNLSLWQPPFEPLFLWVFFFFLRKSQVILCNICLPLFGLFYLPCRFSCSIQGMAESPGENGWVGQRTGSIWNPIPCSILMTRKSYLGNQFLLWKWWSWVLHDGGGDEISIQTSFSFYFAELVFLPSSTKAGLKHLQCLKSHCHI